MPIINACTQEPERPTQGIRREEGKWNQSEVEAIAMEMQKEPQFNDIAYAGVVLLDNQRGNNPSISRLNPLFTDYKINFVTVKDIGALNEKKWKAFSRNADDF